MAKNTGFPQADEDEFKLSEFENYSEVSDKLKSQMSRTIENRKIRKKKLFGSYYEDLLTLDAGLGIHEHNLVVYMSPQVHKMAANEYTST